MPSIFPLDSWKSLIQLHSHMYSRDLEFEIKPSGILK